jgi:hypothetical protein
MCGPRIFLLAIARCSYPAAIVPHHTFGFKRATALFVAAAISLAGCRRPSTSSSQATPEHVPARVGSVQPHPESIAAEVKSGLAASVAQILDAAERTGSLVEHCSCAARGRIAEAHLLESPLTVEPLEKALSEISRRYPEISWKETSDKAVRLSDSKKMPGLLQVRVKEFLVIEDHPPQAALPALWHTAEVAGYMHRHSMHLARTTPQRATVKKTSPTVIQVNNATVAEILDRIVSGYRAQSSFPLYRLWVYRECRSGAETFVEIRVL